MEKEWIFPKKAEEKDLLKALLIKRGIEGKEATDEFLSEKPRLTYDPFLLKNMEEVSQRILKGIEDNEKICVYGDYDADGICSVSLLLEILKKLGGDVVYYIPSRFNEGYGLNEEAIKKLKKADISLIITVDCGSTSYREVEYAKSLNMDVIVTDHHNLDSNPASCLIINPKQNDCIYPDKNLSGCGVAFKLAQALQRKRPEMLGRPDLKRVLDLVAIATIGDIVPLVGENRTMVKYGLQVIRSEGRPGLSHLIQSVSLKDRDIKSEQVAYVIVPHLNAAGRMISAKTGVELMTSRKKDMWDYASQKLINNNRERKRLQDIIFEDAIKQIEAQYPKDRFIVLDLIDAHEGITGIVAGKLKDKFNLPAIILTPTGDNRFKGTGRSIEGINLYDILSANSKLFDKFGGHSGACGFTMEMSKLKILRNVLNAMTESIYEKDPAIFQARLFIDGEIKPPEIDRELILALEKLEPYGHKNPRPVFALRGINPSNPYYMGGQQQHVRFVADGVDCVLFNGAVRFKERLKKGSKVDLAGYPEINRWNGYEKIQFIVEDIK